jgi:hypothetical protein
MGDVLWLAVKLRRFALGEADEHLGIRRIALDEPLPRPSGA